MLNKEGHGQETLKDNQSLFHGLEIPVVAKFLLNNDEYEATNVVDLKKNESILTFVHGNKTLLLLALILLDLLLLHCGRILLLALHQRRRPLKLDLTPTVIHDRHAMSTSLITGIDITFLIHSSVIIDMMMVERPNPVR
jgi:hypothetical protein